MPQNWHYQEQLLHVKTLSYHVILIQRFVLMKNHDSEASLFITWAEFFGIENQLTTMGGGVPVNCCVVIVTLIHHLG